VADPEELRDTDEARLKRFAKLFQAEITGFCAYLGGMAAQEVVKKTGKFTPFNQWIHHEDQALCTDLCGSNSGPTMGTRYDDQISILGKDFCNRAANLQVFMVGCGALGCEYMKALALMGVGTGGRGKVVVTDMDTIEVSNLSRQFLFRSPDVGNSKSKAGARVVGEWNTTMNIEGIEKFVGPSTEDYFNDEFWGSLDLCWNALDNVQARRYTDGRCLWYSKPLLESGTTGTESNHDVILPFRTKSYNDDIEPETTAIAMCTLRAAPYLPLHCIEYAKQLLFNDFFDFGPTQYESFRKDKTKWFNSLSELSPEEQRNALKIVSQMAISQQEKGCVDFGMCIQFAFEMLVSIFRNQVMDAIAAGDKEEENGVKYWTGTKRRPTAVNFNPQEAGPMEFLYAASNMYAFVFKVSYVRDRQAFSAAVCKLHEDGALVQKAHAASGDNVVQEGEEEVKIDVAELDGLTSVLKSVDTAKLALAKVHDFEKDDDSNFHIDFLTSATNLRAWNFGITETPRHRVKVVAGRIIAALATTTAMVCGLVDLEFCKLVLGLENLGADQFLGSYTNLGLGLEQFNAFHPVPAAVVKTNLESFDSFTSWDKIELHESGRTVQQLVSHLETTFQLNVHELSAEMDYNPKGDGPKTLDLWSRSEPADKMLSDIFKSKCSSGAKQTSRSAGSKRRVQSELEKLCNEPLDGYTVTACPSDSFEFNIKLEGPPGSQYEGGLYLISLKLPDQYPLKAPSLVFNTSIEHMNILDGQPCPGLLGLTSWSPTSEVRGLLLQVAQLMKQPEPGDALRTDLSGMDPEQYNAHVRKAVELHATADQEFAAVGAAAEGVAETEPIEWFHDYLILRGSFTNKDGEEAQLPRMKLSSLHESSSSSAAGPAAVEPAAPEIEAKVLAMALDLDDVELKPESCYKPSADRVARWVTVEGAENVTVGNTVVVTCKTADGQTIETLVNTETMEQYMFEDPIMCTCESIVHLVEAQFVEDGPWIMSTGSADAIQGEKGTLFNTYETFVSKDSPECLKGLRTALQKRPVTTVYSGGGGLYGTPPHKGFSLRMPEAEIPDWTFVDDKGQVQPIPRPCCALRVWDASLRSYVPIDPTMTGAPVGPEAVDAWYVALIKKLKSSPYLGPEFIDSLVTCEGYDFDATTSRPMDGSWRGKVQNRWTDLAVASNP
jgi:ubiquitin-protein ligase/molybdopterin/thiamine biosynthesis adenylyltransferase